MEKVDVKTRIMEVFNKIEDLYVKKFLETQLTYIERHMDEKLTEAYEANLRLYVKKEKAQIQKNLTGDCIFNISSKPIPAELSEWVRKGPKFVPYVTKSHKTYLREFDQQFVAITNKIMKFYRSKLTITSSNIQQSVQQAIDQSRNPALKEFLKGIKKSFFTQRLRYKRSVKNPNLHNQEQKLPDNELSQKFDLGADRLMVCSDKNMGFTVMDKADHLEQYTKINLQQSFGLTDVDEPTYITNILGFVREAKAKLPPELSRIVKPKDFEHLDDNPAIGVLRLLPKVAKMSSIDHAHISELKSRGIRSSLKDPLKTIQIVLNKIYGHLLHSMETEFHSRYKRFSPSVTGINEAIERISDSSTGDWGHSLEVQADFSDLYSNCEEDLLKKHVRTGCILADFSAETIEYIMRLFLTSSRDTYGSEMIFRST